MMGPENFEDRSSTFRESHKREDLDSCRTTNVGILSDEASSRAPSARTPGVVICVRRKTAESWTLTKYPDRKERASAASWKLDANPASSLRRARATLWRA